MATFGIVEIPAAITALGVGATPALQALGEGLKKAYKLATAIKQICDEVKDTKDARVRLADKTGLLLECLERIAGAWQSRRGDPAPRAQEHVDKCVEFLEECLRMVTAHRGRNLVLRVLLRKRYLGQFEEATAEIERLQKDLDTVLNVEILDAVVSQGVEEKRRRLGELRRKFEINKKALAKASRKNSEVMQGVHDDLAAKIRALEEELGEAH